MLRTLKIACVALVLVTTVAAGPSAMACPMCKAAIEDTENPAAAARPKAYMYSILFMISMPATLFTVFSISFYRLSRKQQGMNDAYLDDPTGTSHLS